MHLTIRSRIFRLLFTVSIPGRSILKSWLTPAMPEITLGEHMAKINESDSGWLFPRLDPVAAHGLTRLAAESQPASDGHNVTYRYLESRSVLNRSTSKRGLSFRWSVNPYRGCEFACRYCYARYTHEFMGLNKAEDFEKQIFIKKYAAAQLDRELATLPLSEGIAIGTSQSSGAKD